MVTFRQRVKFYFNNSLNFLDRLTQNKILFATVLAGIFVAGFAITYFILSQSGSSVKIPIINPNEFAKATPAPVNEVNPEKGVYNITLLGYGGAGHEGSLLTDSIIIAHIDTNSHKVTLITIPRDLWVTGNHKINSAGISLGFQNTGLELQNVTGLPINYFVAVDFGSFVKLIDTLEGISIQVPNTFDDPFYPILGQENNTCGKAGDEIQVLKTKYSGFDLEKQFVCRYEHLHFDKGPVTLDGTAALKFVRSRHGDSDFGRSLRQVAVLQGILNKLISFQSAGKIDDIIDSLSKLVKTNLNAGIIKTLIDIIGDPKAYQTAHIQLTTDNVLRESKSGEGAYILIPKTGNLNFSEVKAYIKNNLN